MGGSSDPASMNLYGADGSTVAVHLDAGNVSYFNGGRVGIGTASPSDLLHITNGDNAIDTRIRIHAFGQLPIYNTYYASGTESSPTAPTADTEVMRIEAMTWDGNDYSQSAGRISLTAQSNHASDDAHSYMSFATCNDATRLSTEKMRITGEGAFHFIGSTDFDRAGLIENSASTFNFHASSSSSYDKPISFYRGNQGGDLILTLGSDLNSTFYGHILPSANNTKALGSDGNMWDVVWTNEINASADGIIYMCNSGGTVEMDGRVNFKDIIWGESTYGLRFYRSDLGVENFRISDNSDVTGGHGSYHTSSDETLKKNISTISSGLDKVNAMRGVEFKWKKEHDPHPEGETNHQRVNLGFIAQELETVVPEVVNTNSVTGLKAVLDANQLTAVLVEAIKELSDKLDTANAKITALENA